MKKPFRISLLLLFAFAVGCAKPVFWYQTPQALNLHFDFDPTLLNCIELSEESVRVSNIVEDLADKLVNEADRNVSSVFFGFRTNNPLTGKNYFGVGSESVNPAVYEFRRLQLLLEQIETLQIDNCSPTIITITEEQG